MNDHLTQNEILDYVRGSARGVDLLQIDDHLADCPLCRETAAKESGGMTRDYPFADDGSGPGHLMFEQLSAYADGQMDDVAMEVAEVHLRSCDSCADQVRAIEEVRDEMFNRPSIVEVPQSQGRPFEWFAGLRALKFAIPVVLVAVAVGTALWWSLGSKEKEGSLPVAAISDQQPAPLAADPANANEPTANEAPAAEPDLAAITLSDSGRELKIDANGKVIGEFAGEFDQRIEAAIRSGEVPVSDDVARLRTTADTLLGESTDPGLRVKFPVGKVLIETQPEISWTPIAGAESYTVEIFDSNFNKVVTSPPVSSSRWKTSSPLSRGAQYSWQVTAIKNGESIRAPMRPAPDANFVILSENKNQLIKRARREYGNSHLVMGLIYAEAGLIDLAAREFKQLSGKNSTSPVAAKLLKSIQQNR